MEKEIELEQEAIVVYSGGGAVNSVNGYTGDVVLTTSDLENTSDYQTGTEVESAISTAIAGKQDTLTAGNNITISNNTISATNTTYSAGSGLTLNGTQFSVDTSTIATQQNVSDEATARENADINLQGQIDAISAASDVTDIVGTYAALQAYDTTHLKDNDIIKVLQDESQNDETTYYRWSTTTETFTLIGEEGPYYTKSATDILLQGKQDTLTAGSNITIGSDNTISATDTTYTAGTNISISSGNVISATDTTYSNFVGTDGTAAGTAGLVPAPATTDAGKFLGASGLWETIQAGGGITELTSANYNYPAGNATGVLPLLLTAGLYKLPKDLYWWDISSSSTNPHAEQATTDLYFIVVTNTNQAYTMIIDPSKTGSAGTRGWNAVKIIYGKPDGTIQGCNNLLATSTIKDNLTSTETNYPLSANQGKVLKDLVDSLAISGAGAPTTSTVGTVGKLYEDTTNGKLYICTDTTGGTYTWEEVGAGGGGGPTVVQTTGTSTTDVMSQNAVTGMIFADPDMLYRVKIGNSSTSSANNTIAIGTDSSATEISCIAIGGQAVARSNYAAVAIGANSLATGQGSIALGRCSSASQRGEMNIGSTQTSYGYNNSNYRLLTGLYDGQSAHDAATVAQGNKLMTAAPTTSDVGVLGQLWTDTTNMHTYQCTAISGSTYTWTQRW